MLTWENLEIRNDLADPGLKSGLGVLELLSILKTKWIHGRGFVKSFPKIHSLHVRKKPPPPLGYVGFLLSVVSDLKKLRSNFDHAWNTGRPCFKPDVKLDKTDLV